MDTKREKGVLGMQADATSETVSHAERMKEEEGGEGQREETDSLTKRSR